MWRRIIVVGCLRWKGVNDMNLHVDATRQT
jgi:hypothetical protein